MREQKILSPYKALKMETVELPEHRNGSDRKQKSNSWKSNEVIQNQNVLDAKEKQVLFCEDIPSRKECSTFH